VVTDRILRPPSFASPRRSPRASPCLTCLDTENTLRPGNTPDPGEISRAQRHADAGVPIDVLRDLMDHQQTSTTQGYYRVTQKRKRDAVRTLHRQVIDRTGISVPAPSQTAYELRSVAAPFGNCIEPSNVKAGGGACPIRFQCSGCGFYRADPSYIPAIEDHVQALRADRETASAMDVDNFVLRNLTDQITSYQNVLESMHRTGQL